MKHVKVTNLMTQAKRPKTALTRKDSHSYNKMSYVLFKKKWRYLKHGYYWTVVNC